jgi:GT2 family glycosyltransferase
MVSVIIPTLFPTEALGQYAEKLTRYKGVKEVIVVVNGEDETPSPPPRVAGELPQGSTSFPWEGTRRGKGVIWNFLGKNLGFTGACNAGAKVAVGDLILFLNDDCDMTEEAFLALVDFMKKNVDVVATQPIVKKQILNSKSETLNDEEEGSLHPRSARSRDDAAQGRDIENIGFWVYTRMGKAIPVTETLNSKLETLREKDRSIYGLSGTCLLIRKDIFENIGMWDESFHSYLEDVDLAIRLHKAGYHTAPCLEAEVTHEHMATSSKMGLYKEKQDVINWWRLVLKHPDVFVRPCTIFPLLLERGRNMSGLIKKILRRVIQ